MFLSIELHKGDVFTIKLGFALGLPYVLREFFFEGGILCVDTLVICYRQQKLQ